jgi:molybdenum cofactor guanylyltransferase
VVETNTHVYVLPDYTRKPAGQSFFVGVKCYYLVMQGAGPTAFTDSEGFILAGGNSRRMGDDKALLPLNGHPLIEHVAGCVKAAAGSVTLVGAPGRYTQFNIPAIPDLYPGFGPVGGIVTALSASKAEWNLVVACDMPAITADFLRSLLAEAREQGAECTMPVTPDGRTHPLCAVYRRSANGQLSRAVAAGTHRLHSAIEALTVHFFPVSHAGWLANVNTPAEWTSFQDAAN